MVGLVSRWFECPRIMLRCLSPAFIFLDYVSGTIKSQLTREWVVPMSFPQKGEVYWSYHPKTLNSVLQAPIEKV